MSGRLVDARWGLAIAIALLGCEAAPDLGAGCARSSDCSAPLVCAIGRCRVECADSRDCPTLARCLVEPSSGVGVCSLDRVDSCATHACAIGFLCQRGACVNACGAIASCPDGVCEDGACTPVRGDAGMLADAGAVVDAGDDAAASQRTITATIVEDADDGQIAGTFLFVRGEVNDGLDYFGYWSPDGLTRAFLRFTLPEAIPSGATILEAHVELVATTTAGLCGATDHVAVVATDSADAPQPVDASSFPGGLTGGTVTSTSVSWGALSDWPDGATVSPDVAPILDELVRAHGGLAAGAHVALWVWGVDYMHDAEASWADSSRLDDDDPRLVVRFVP